MATLQGMALAHLAPDLLRTPRDGTGERRMRNLLIAVATLMGVLMMATQVARTF